MESHQKKVALLWDDGKPYVIVDNERVYLDDTNCIMNAAEFPLSERKPVYQFQRTKKDIPIGITPHDDVHTMD